MAAKRMGPMKKKPGQKGFKVEKTMREFKAGALHSGSKTGPKVKSRKQAVAIGLSQEAKAEGKPSAKQHAKNVAASKRKNAADANRRPRNKGRS
jgi:hypothetical protein